MAVRKMAASGGVPANVYDAIFDGEEAYTENAERFGEGVLLKWKVVGGEFDGQLATRITSTIFSKKSNLHAFARQVSGKDLEPGDEFDFTDYVGTKGSLIVEETEAGSGSTRVAKFIRTP